MRFYRHRKAVIGYAQQKALEMLVRRGVNSEPKAGEVTHTGVLRFHTFVDMAADGLVKIERGKPDRHGIVPVRVTATEAGRKALAAAKVARPPQRRVRPRLVHSRATRGGVAAVH